MESLKEYAKLDIEQNDWQNFKTNEQITQISEYIQNSAYTIVLKGRKDIIIGNRSFICDIEGSRKRCGGIGDIFAGITGVCTFWNPDLGPILASKITKQATKSAFQKYGRSVTALSIISELPKTVMRIQNQFK